MKFEILKQEDNRLLNRRQFIVKITDVNVTPKREDIWKSFAVKQGLDEKRLVVDTIDSQTGLKDVKAYIKYYDDEVSLKKVEVKNNLKKLEKLLPKQEAPKKEKKDEIPKDNVPAKEELKEVKDVSTKAKVDETVKDTKSEAKEGNKTGDN